MSLFFFLAPGPLLLMVVVVLSTTEVGSLRRLCWKSCRTLEETPEDEVELIVEVRLCPCAAAGSDELGSLEMMDSAEEDPGADAVAAEDEDEETGADG